MDQRPTSEGTFGTVNDVYVLVHSPLVGPLTWSRVADEMRLRGLDVFVPPMEDAPGSKDPSWKQHAGAVSRAVETLPKDTPVILVAHSGAGPLLPAIRQFISNPVRAYAFVDAGIPRHGATRLDLMKFEDPAWAAGFLYRTHSRVRGLAGCAVCVHPIQCAL